MAQTDKTFIMDVEGRGISTHDRSPYREFGSLSRIGKSRKEKSLKLTIGVCVFGCILSELEKFSSLYMESTRMVRNKS